jgi:CTP:molybdopterin cytidylyltransferase MocA
MGAFEEMTESRLGILILAAGEARRFGACKQLAHFLKKPLLQHVVDAALPLPHKRLIIVTGFFRVYRHNTTAKCCLVRTFTLLFF